MKFIDYHHFEVLQKPGEDDKQVNCPSECDRTFSNALRAAELKHVAYPAVGMSPHHGSIQPRGHTKLVKITDARSLIPIGAYKVRAPQIPGFEDTPSLFSFGVSPS